MYRRPQETWNERDRGKEEDTAAHMLVLYILYQERMCIRGRKGGGGAMYLYKRPGCELLRSLILPTRMP